MLKVIKDALQLHLGCLKSINRTLEAFMKRLTPFFKILSNGGKVIIISSLNLGLSSKVLSFDIHAKCIATSISSLISDILFMSLISPLIFVKFL